MTRDSDRHQALAMITERLDRLDDDPCGSGVEPAAVVEGAGSRAVERPAPHPLDLDPSFTSSASSASSAGPNGWPPVDATAFYGLPGEVVTALSPHTEADPIALLLTYLTAFGAAVGRGPHALADGAEHPGRLFAVLVGDTAKARKGTSWQQVRRIYFAADARFTDERTLGGFGSGESIVDAVANGNDHRLLVIEPEWARVLSVARREGSTLSALLREAWDGGRLAARSRQAGSIVADDAHVCMLGHVTVEELRAKLVDTEVSNGFANRHLFALVRRSQLLPSGGNFSDQDVAALGVRTNNALRHARTIGRIVRTPAAERYWNDRYYEMAADNPGGLLGSVIARDAAQVLRLSVLYALSSASASVDVPHLEAAWAVWKYCRESATFIFGSAIGKSVADRLLRALRAARPLGLDGREMDRALCGHAKPGEIKAALALLQRKGFTRTQTVESGGRPRTITFALEDKADKAEKGLVA